MSTSHNARGKSILPDTRKKAPPMDFGRLQLVCETEKDEADILTLFFRLAKEFIAAMEEARHDEKFLQWKNAAHSLKGSAINLGMIALGELCSQSEKGAELTYDQRTGLLRQLKDEVENIKVYICTQNPSLLHSGT